jgi:hypothetical protein
MHDHEPACPQIWRSRGSFTFSDLLLDFVQGLVFSSSDRPALRIERARGAIQ